MQTTDYTTMNREEIRNDIINSIGDTELPEQVREWLVNDLEDRYMVTPDEFWALVEIEFTRYENAQAAA